MNWHVTITISGNMPVSHPSSQLQHPGPRFAGSAISMGDPSAAVHILFLAADVDGGIGAAKQAGHEAAPLSMYAVLAVSTFSLWALSMALFRVEEQRTERRAQQQRAEAAPGTVAAARKKHGADAPPAPATTAQTGPAALPLNQRTGVVKESRAPAADLRDGPPKADDAWIDSLGVD